MKHKVYVSDIQWDTDGLYWNDELDPVLYPEARVSNELELPWTTEIIVDDTDVDVSDPDALSGYISDWLSDRYGVCHNGFSFDVVWDYDNVR